GAEGRKNLVLDSKAVREDMYYEAGRIVAVCMVHGGPAPGFFSTTLFDCLVSGPETAKPVIEDIADCELFENIKRLFDSLISDSTSLQDLQVCTDACVDYLANAGCLRPIKHLREKDILVLDVLMFQIVNRVRGPFERLKEGMKTLLEKIKQYLESFRPLLCYRPLTLTADILDDLFHIRFAPTGSNQRLTESRVVAFWRDFSQDAEGSILDFATGSSVVPPVGYCPKPSVEFLHGQDIDVVTLPKFPIANTCVNCLHLPLLDRYEDFKANMDFGLCNTQGFGLE
ncbi:G2E3 ligase, partial [Amia calva]|nr:G2E3 ligase [Amia calva]